MDDDFMNTGWDPHSALLQCEENLRQCAIAINQGTEVMRDLANKYNHQQEVIQQLMFQNRKLQGSVQQLREQLVRYDTELHLIKVKQSQ